MHSQPSFLNVLRFVVAVLFKMQIGDEKHQLRNQGMKTDINAQ